ncbi:hypothetical protein SEPCBS57363_006627 [Sporothrix epigloea]|uniref:Protein prenyltransferase n=1 Tax=Sporothrix epigloea TaxID=1892477 RepID=A0ABP0E418_9PEZI
MSRAIDRDTAAAIQIGDPEGAFCAIADVLTKEPTLLSPLEFEFLGREYPPLPAGEYLLHDGNAVAIPKLALLQAFTVARKTLQNHRADTLESHCSDDSHNQSIWRATAVMLLFDPEHLTAANTRKRLIRASLLQEPVSSAAASEFSLLSRELHLVDSLLTSHLHRHTKSPTLWSHRRWLLHFLATSAVKKSREEGYTILLHGITKVVMVAAVRHPRNYYAWEHARWLVCWLQTNSQEKDKNVNLVVIARDWCYRNHTDTSGWSFLFFLLASLSLPPSAASLSPLYEETVAHVEQMAKSLRWTGEAVWVFLRTAVAYQRRIRGDNFEACRDFEEAVSALLATVDTISNDHRVLQRSQKWLAINAPERIPAST